MPDLDSNKVLTDFIWSKIISNSKTSALSKTARPHIPLVTIPYKPNSEHNSAPLISRRSLNSLNTHLNTLPSNPSSLVSLSNFSFEAAAESIAKKYLSDTQGLSSFNEKSLDQYNPASLKTSNANTAKPEIKSSYSESETNKNYFINTFHDRTEKNQQSKSKSVYDLVPMPTYGYSKFSGGNEQNKIYQSKKTFEILPMIREGMIEDPYNNKQIEPQIIEVTPDEPIQVVFRSISTRVQVQQIHTPNKPEEVETTRTEEEPQRVVHQLLRPVIQEVFEVIQPYRRVTQEVRPVLEEVHTIVAKNSAQQTLPGSQRQRPNNQPIGFKQQREKMFSSNVNQYAAHSRNSNKNFGTNIQNDNYHNNGEFQYNKMQNYGYKNS